MNQTSMISSYYLPTTNNYTPNSKLPILVYRQVLPLSIFNNNDCELTLQNKIAQLLHEWQVTKAWPSVTTPHYHPNVHELYAIIKGSSELILGLDLRVDDNDSSIEIMVTKGDVIIIPAGISHCSKQYDRNYRYVAAYPINGEHWQTINKSNIDYMGDCHDIINQVPLPVCDPILGYQQGGLLDIWTKVT